MIESSAPAGRVGWLEQISEILDRIDGEEYKSVYKITYYRAAGDIKEEVVCYSSASSIIEAILELEESKGFPLMEDLGIDIDELIVAEREGVFSQQGEFYDMISSGGQWNYYDLNIAFFLTVQINSDAEWLLAGARSIEMADSFGQEIRDAAKGSQLISSGDEILLKSENEFEKLKKDWIGGK